MIMCTSMEIMLLRASNALEVLAHEQSLQILEVRARVRLWEYTSCLACLANATSSTRMKCCHS